jgi:hypothetical protein
MAFIKDYKIDKDGFKYLFLDLPLEQKLIPVYSIRHAALLIVEEDLRNFETGKPYTNDKTLEIIVNDKPKQYGIVQIISVEMLKQLRTMYRMLDDNGFIKEPDLKGYKVENELSIKIKKEEDERKKRMKEIKEKTKEKSAEQKQLFGESDIIETDTELEESSWGQDEESEE